MKKLIIFYSQGGTTELVARTLAKKLRADLLKIHDLKNREGFKNKLLSSINAYRETKTDIVPASVDLTDVEILENGQSVGKFTALNDAVITSGFISRIVDISVAVGKDAISYRADGLIVSTPTGSTAYSMSAGGPIIDPSTENICITPICSHSLSAKPILMSADTTLTLKSFSKKRTEIYLTVDGRKVANIKPYSEIKITKSNNFVQLIRLSNRSFYKTMSVKFKDSRSV